MKPLISLATLAVALGCSGAQAQYTDGTIRIGVLNDMSGTYSDLSGRGSLIATRMAVEDFGAAAKGMKVEIVGADHQNKPDVGSNIVRKWIDTGKVARSNPPITVAPVKAAMRIMFLPPEIDLPTRSQLLRAERAWIFAALRRLKTSIDFICRRGPGTLTKS